MDSETIQKGLTWGYSSPMESAGELTRHYREAAKLSLEEVAAKLGVSPGAVGHWETGRTSPRRGNAIKLDRMFSADGRILAAFGYVIDTEPVASTHPDWDIQRIDYQALLDALDRSNHRLDDHFDEVRRELQELRRQLDDLDRRENNSHQ
jgi:transcriptional regulator with XRE-family HTH domain